MTTKSQLYAKLQDTQAQVFQLQKENEELKRTLHNIYAQTRTILGIEHAAQQREDNATKNYTFSQR